MVINKNETFFRTMDEIKSEWDCSNGCFSLGEDSKMSEILKVLSKRDFLNGRLRQTVIYKEKHNPPTLQEKLKRWGGWTTLDGLELNYRKAGFYPITIDRFTNSAERLDIIMDVANKDWATDKCLAGLVRAINDIQTQQDLVE
jgi:hypothetical protein